MKNIILIFAICFILQNIKAQWREVSNPSLSNIDQAKFVNKNIGYACCKTGILKTIDGGENWVKLPFTNAFLISSYIATIEILDSNILVIGGYYEVTDQNIIAKSIDGGINWTIFLNPGSVNYPHNSITVIYFIDKNNGFAVDKLGNFFKSIDGGLSWTSKQITTHPINDVYFLNSDTGFIIVEQDIKKTIDGGKTWKSQTVPSFVSKINFIDINNAFVIGAKGLFETTDCGESWILKSNEVSSNTLVFTSFNNGFVQNYKTTTGGLYWELMEDTDFYPSSIYMLDSLTGFAFCWGGKVFKTTNAGGLALPILKMKDNLTSIQCLGDTIQFEITSNPKYTYQWFINDSLAGQDNILKFLANKEVYKIDLVGYNDNVYDTISKSFNVKNHPFLDTIKLSLVSYLNDSVQECSNFEINLAKSTKGSNYQLMQNSVKIGNPIVGTGNLLKFFSFSINSDSKFTIIGTSSNSCFTDTLIGNIDVFVLPGSNSTNVIAEDTMLCKGDSTNIKVLNSRKNVFYQLYNGNKKIGVEHIGNGNVLNLSTSSILKTTKYTVLAWPKTNINCKKTITKSVTIKIDSVIADFYLPSDNYFINDSIHLKNTSYCNRFEWTLISNNLEIIKDTLPNPTLKYSFPTAQLIQLIANSNYGCTEKMIKEVRVYDTPKSLPLKNCFFKEIDMNNVSDIYKELNNPNINNISHFNNSYINSYIDDKNNLYLVDYYTSPCKGNFTDGGTSYSFDLSKYNSDGTQIWKKQFNPCIKNFPNDFYSTFITGITVDTTGNIFVSGNFASSRIYFDSILVQDQNYNAPPEAFTAQLDSSGIFKWVVYTRKTSIGRIGMSDIQQLPNGNLEIIITDLQGFIVFTDNTTFKNTSQYADNPGTGLLEITKKGCFVNYKNITIDSTSLNGYYWCPSLEAYYTVKTYSKYPEFKEGPLGKQIIFKPYMEYIFLSNTVTNKNEILTPKQIKVIKGNSIKIENVVYNDNYFYIMAIVYNKFANERLELANYSKDSIIVAIGNDTIRAFDFGIRITCKMDLNGNIIWSNYYNNLYINNIIKENDGNIYFTGSFFDFMGWNKNKNPTYGLKPKGLIDMVIGTLNSNTGDLIGITQIANNNNDLPMALFKDNYGDIYLISSHNDKIAFGNDTINCTSHAIFSKYAYDTNKSCTPVAIPSIKNNLFTDEPDNNSQIQIYPNPAKNILYINQNSDEKISIQITNAFGQIILNNKFSNNTITIDISNFKKGMYFLKFYSNESTYVKKFIKN